jgi:hypothetical protein
MDIVQSAHFLKSIAEISRSFDAQDAFSAWPSDGRRFSMDLSQALHFFRIAAEHKITDLHCTSEIRLLKHRSRHREIAGAIQSLNLSPDNKNSSALP